MPVWWLVGEKNTNKGKSPSFLSGSGSPTENIGASRSKTHVSENLRSASVRTAFHIFDQPTNLCIGLGNISLIWEHAFSFAKRELRFYRKYYKNNFHIKMILASLESN
jgi:hypothetical protein